MANSPISQLLCTLGLSREELGRHSDQMRRFLTDNDHNNNNNNNNNRPDNDHHSRPSHSSMDIVLERQRRLSRRDRRSRKDRERANLDAFMLARDASRDDRPVTPLSSPLPINEPSSPRVPSSPLSSPLRPINLVSSPGPVPPLPTEDDYDNLPYSLPPGPYSTTKPDLSYAALVGQAILSSPEHRLTLQEIYDWITIVYPHFKRGETTWMNSIRHVLSTTVCFRKVPRDRSLGRTQWAIWDDDLECFKGGNFRKHFCKDYMDQVAAKDKLSKGKARARRRPDLDDRDSRKSKRLRKDSLSSPVFPPSSSSSSSATFAPLFPPTRPTPHHQSYYQSCINNHALPAEIIFPPLPPASAFNRVLYHRNESSSATSSAGATSPLQTLPSFFSNTPTSSASSVPGLTPNRHSSSSPSMPATSDMDLDALTDPNITDQSDSQDADLLSPVASTTLKPVRFWGDQPNPNALEPGIHLLSTKRVVSEDEDVLLKSKAVGQRQSSSIQVNCSCPLTLGSEISAQGVPPLFVPPTSPTLERRAAKTPLLLLDPQVESSNRPMTPTPCTPPPLLSSRHLQFSSVRTPLSHKGLHMSPNASLAHYKSHLDPPPTVPFEEADDDHDPLKTPRRRKDSNQGNPLTPRKLFSSSMMDSPFRTPNGVGSSPFSRTPQAKPVLDPQDPRTLLDDELQRMGTLSDSPGGLFGKSRSSLLYDSPGGLDLPGKYRSWW